ncbi:hypothetical protein [Clostridium culturomicium]|uniref:hypothetical protein n=1 Tax=Clostridium culturomicium TaxID=1499683 RepID=UPI003857D5FD
MEHSGFFNGDQEYGQEEFNRYFDNIYESGLSVKDDNTMTLGVTSEASTIKVDRGFAIVKGFYLYNDSIKSITVTSDSNYDRIDRVVIRLNISNSKVTIEMKKGIAGSKPQPPTLQRDSLIYELSLAQVYVPRSGTITLTDERYRNELCGAIRPKNLTEFNSMLKGFTEQFDRWFNSQQAKGWRNVFIQAERPEESVRGSIWIQTLT